jgi:segregation and condensation protein B
MSLKAKIEAVIYAAEEPVTLAQLAGLFADEALEEKRAREAAAQAAEPANEAEVVLSTEIQSPEDSLLPVEEADGLIPEEYASPLTVEEAAVLAGQSAGEEEAPAAEAGAPSAEDEKKAARQRDREVREELRRVVGELIADYADSDRGMEVREIAGGYRVGTKPEYHDAVRGFVKSLKPPMKLSLQALETLAVIAYKQPVTAPEVGEIRGVDSAGVIGSLISRKLITTAGRKQVIGRPILYKTTKEFLLRFGLKDLNELPSIEEFEKMAAGELAEAEELPFQEQQTLHVPDEVDEEDEAEETARAQAAVEITDETAEDAADLPGIVVEEVEIEIEVEETDVIVEASSEEPAKATHGQSHE